MDLDDVIYLLSENADRYEDIDLGGTQVLRTEDVFVDLGECQMGDLWGSVTVEETDTNKGDGVLVSATFQKLTGDTLVMKGLGKRVTHNDKPSFEGRFPVLGGTGKFAGFRGQVQVENCNPKRWSITGP